MRGDCAAFVRPWEVRRNRISGINREREAFGRGETELPMNVVVRHGGAGASTENIFGVRISELRWRSCRLCDR